MGASRRNKRHVIQIMGGLIALTLIGCGVWYFPYRLINPLNEDMVKFSELERGEKISARRTSEGFWSVQAPTEMDGLRALGFLFAHDRLFQMDMSRRMAGGRLSEAIGEDAFALDVLNRSYGYRQIAETDVGPEGWLSQAQNVATREALQAYLDGVNAYVNRIEEQFWHWPPEYRLLGFQPEPFSLTDTILSLASMHLYFNNASVGEITNSHILQRFDSYLELFFGNLPSTLRRTEEDLSSPLASLQKVPPKEQRESGIEKRRRELATEETLQIPHISQLKSLLPWEFPGLISKTGAGSNAWICSGERMSNGLPTLANDPHLGLGLPGFLNMARLETPEVTHVGAYIPLIPFPVIGFSEFGSWGMTFSEIDQTDFYSLELDSEDLNGAESYRFDDSWLPLKKQTETITVKGEGVREITLARTHLGPVIPLTSQEKRHTKDHFLVVADVSLFPGNPGIKTLRTISRAKDREAFFIGLKEHVSPPQNVFWVGTNGEIGWGLAGQVVERGWSFADAARPHFPTLSAQEVHANAARAPQIADVPGSVILPMQSAFVWKRRRSGFEMAHGTSFQEGCLGNANESLTWGTKDLPELASTDWSLGLRAHRIAEELAARPKHSLADFQRMQLDDINNLAVFSLPLITDYLQSQREQLSDSEWGRLEALAAWDTQSAIASREQLLFEILLTQWRQHVFQRLDDPELARYLEDRGKHNARLVLTWAQLLGENLSSPSGELVAGALLDAFKELPDIFAKHGLAIDRTTWGEVHVFQPRHALAQVPILGRLFEYPPVPSSGTQTSLRVQGPKPYLGTFDFRTQHGAGLRLVISPQEKAAWLALPSGASGVPGHPEFERHQDSYVQGLFSRIPLRDVH